MSLNPSIRKVVPASPPTAAANYDYFDIAEGTGVKNFYACQAVASGAVTSYYLTTDNTIISGKTAEKIQGVNGLLSDVDYDVTFNLPKIIKGKIRITFSQGASSDSGNPSLSLYILLYKVSGATITQIGTQAESIGTTQIGAGLTSDQRNLTISVDDRVHFKSGDIFRVNVQMRGTVGAAPDTVGYGCDPAGRDDIVDASGAIVITAGETTQFKVGVPFIIDI